MKFYTYLYTDPSTSEPIYVGKGSGSRAWVHLRSVRDYPFYQRLSEMKKNGIAPTITMLCEGVDAELAFLCETMAIEKYGRKDIGTGSLLNQNNGGAGFGIGHSAAARKKIGVASKKNWKDPAFKKSVGAKISKAKLKPCTIDGVTIYESRLALVADLGHTKYGDRHPNFRFLGARL